MKTIAMIMLAVTSIGCSCSQYVCDKDKQERLIMECLDRTSAHIVNPGEDVDLGHAVWSCRDMARDLSCWYEEKKWSWK
jgi:hypothetical protein